MNCPNSARVLLSQTGEIRDDPDCVVQHFTTACNTYLVFNGTKAPFNNVNVRVRQAPSLATCLQAIFHPVGFDVELKQESAVDIGSLAARDYDCAISSSC
jgi:ABC-type transport system substrate-binding protein